VAQIDSKIKICGYIFAEEKRIFCLRTHFEELVQDLLQAEFRIPEAYGMGTVIEKPHESACFLGVSLGPHSEKPYTVL
jgi:hypothetical protein